MMNNMMDSMIRSMSIEEREEMMMEMMPEMMKRADLKILTPNMLKQLGGMVTLTNVYDLVYKIVKDEELKNSLAGKLKNMKDKMPAMMSMMMPMMINFMPKMMSFMMPMMSEMISLCKSDGGSMMKSSPEMKKTMAVCMQNMCPNCVEVVYPSISREERTPFALNMIQSISRQGSLDMVDSEKEEFKKQALEKVNDGVLINK
jgi:hypothetical protein